MGEDQGTDAQGADTQGMDTQGMDTQDIDTQGADTQDTETQGTDSQGTDTQGTSTQGTAEARPHAQSPDAPEPAAADPLAAARRAWTAAGFRTGDFGEALTAVEAARAQAQLRGDRVAEAEATVLQGLILHYQSITILIGGGEIADAAVAAEEELFRAGFAMAEALGARACTAAALFGLGLVQQIFHEDWNAAMPYYRSAEALIPALEAAGDRYTQSEIHRHLGFHHLLVDGQPAEALRHLQLSHDLRIADGEPLRIPSGRVALGQAQLANGQFAQAVQTLRTAVAEARAAGLLPGWIEDAERELRAAERASAASDPTATA